MDLTTLILILVALNSQQNGKTLVRERLLHREVAYCWTKSIKTPSPLDIAMDDPNIISSEDSERLRFLANEMRAKSCGVRIEGYGAGKNKNDAAIMRAEKIRSYLVNDLSVSPDQVDVVNKSTDKEAGPLKNQKKIARIVF